MFFPGFRTGTPEALARMIADRESRSGGGGGISDYLGLGGAAGGMGLGALIGSVIPGPGTLLGMLTGAGLGGALGGLGGGAAQVAMTPEDGGDPRARQYAGLGQQALQTLASTGANIAAMSQGPGQPPAGRSVVPRTAPSPRAQTGPFQEGQYGNPAAPPRVFPQQTLDAMSPAMSYQAKTGALPAQSSSLSWGMRPTPMDLENRYASLLARRRRGFL